MATDVNPLDNLNTLLSDNWNSANTDSITPTIAKIYDRGKEQDMRSGDFVFTYQRADTDMLPTGIGPDPTVNVDEPVNIDIRVYDKNTSDSHARKVRAEVLRILASNRTNPDSDFQELGLFGGITDLSDRTRKIFRYIIKVNLKVWCRDLTA